MRTETFTLSLLYYELLSLRHPLDDVDAALEVVQHAPIENLRTMARRWCRGSPARSAGCSWSAPRSSGRR